APLARGPDQAVGPEAGLRARHAPRRAPHPPARRRGRRRAAPRAGGGAPPPARGAGALARPRRPPRPRPPRGDHHHRRAVPRAPGRGAGTRGPALSRRHGGRRGVIMVPLRHVLAQGPMLRALGSLVRVAFSKPPSVTVRGRLPPDTPRSSESELRS